MPTNDTGSWRVETRDDGTVVDVEASDPSFRLTDAMKAEMVRTINADVAAGIAPPDVATWGYEYRNHHPYGSDAFVWVSYLGHIWGAIDDGGVAEDKRQREAKVLEGILADLIKHGTGAGRIRGYGGWRPEVGTVLRDRSGQRYRVEEHREARDLDIGPHIGLRVLGERPNESTLLFWRDYERYAVVS